LQIPIDAKPVAWLHNLAFSNAIANVSASDGSDSLVLGTGDGACNFNKGDYPGTNAWIGIRYNASDGTPCGMVAPLTKEHGLTAQFTTDFTVEYTGLAATLDGMSIAQVYQAINNAFSHALNSPTYAAKSAQKKTGMNSPGAAILDGTTIKVVVMPLPGSTGGNVLTYNGVNHCLVSASSWLNTVCASSFCWRGGRRLWHRAIPCRPAHKSTISL
jgi:hypothetical protein